VALILIACVGAALTGRLSTEASRRLAAMLMERLEPLLQSGWSVDSVRVKYGSVHLFGVRYRGAGPYELWLEDVRVGYSITNLLRYRFHAENLPNSILCLRPHLVLHLYARRDSVSQSPSEASVTALALQRLSFLENIVVADGQISCSDSSGNRWCILDEVDGWVYRANDWSACLQLAARPHGAGDISVELLGRFDLGRGRLDTLRANVREYEIGRHFPFLLPSFLEVDRGRFAGNFTLVENPLLPEGFDLKGQARLRRGRILFRSTQLRCDSIFFEARVEHWNLQLDSVFFRLSGSPARASGLVQNLFDPRLDLTLRSDSVDIGALRNQLNLPPSVYPTGTANFYARLSGHYRNPRLEAELRMPEGRLGSRPIRHLEVRCVLSDSVLRLATFSARLPAGALSGHAMLDLRRSPAHLDASALFVIRPLALGTQNTLLHDSLAARFQGEVSGGELSVQAALHAPGRPPLRLRGEGHASVTGARLSLASQPAGFRAEGECSLTRDGSLRDFRVDVRGLERISPYLGGPALPRFVDNELDIGARFSGTPHRVRASGQVVRADATNSRSLLSAEGELLSTGRKRWEGNFDLQYVPAPGQMASGTLRILADRRKYSSAYALLQLGNWLRAEMEENQREPLRRFSVQVQSAPLAMLLGSHAEHYRGFLDAAFAYEKRTSEPVFQFSLGATDVLGHGIGPYRLQLHAAGQGNLITADSLRVLFRDRPAVNGICTVDLKRKEVRGTIRGDTLRLRPLLSTFGAPDTVVDGSLSFWANIQGPLETPEIMGEALASDGRVFFEPFDILRLAFSSDTSDSLRPGQVSIDHVLIQRGNTYRLEGEGRVRLSRGLPLQLSIRGSANVLQVIADALGFLRNPSCDGRVRLDLEGPLTSPRLTQAAISFTNGRSEFSGILPKATDVKGQVQLEADGFVRLVDLSGKMGGEWFRITNARASEAPCSVPVEEFAAPSLGLSFGVLVFETGTRGVPLNLYGLQEKGDFGFYQFLGAEANEKFVLAGPWEKPHIRGTWMLRDVAFQYPFVEGAGGKRSWVLDFLSRAEWDLRLIPAHNVRYVRTIPSAIDNVYVNLALDEGGEGVRLIGSPGEGTFRLAGRIESRQGFVEYLDLTFRLESAGAEFDRESLYPVVWGRARATVTDTTGMPVSLYLTLMLEDYSEERRLDQRVRDRQSRGRWDRIRFQLSTDHAGSGESEAEILGMLGYSDRKLKEKAAEMVGMSAENWLVRPLVRPFERGLQRALRFDLVRFRSRIARNFIEWNLANQSYSPWYLVRSTRWEVGKYLMNDVFLLYTGEVQTGLRYEPHQQKLGLRHTFGLEYRLSPDLILELAYDYDSLLLWQKTDKKILLRHSFPF
jgi:hypothetical protein